MTSLAHTDHSRSTPAAALRDVAHSPSELTQLHAMIQRVARRLTPITEGSGLFELQREAGALADLPAHTPLANAMRDLLAALVGDMDNTHPNGPLLLKAGLNMHGHGCREALNEVGRLYALTASDLKTLETVLSGNVSHKMHGCVTLADTIRFKQHNGTLFSGNPLHYSGF